MHRNKKSRYPADLLCRPNWFWRRIFSWISALAKYLCYEMWEELNIQEGLTQIRQHRGLFCTLPKGI